MQAAAQAVQWPSPEVERLFESGRTALSSGNARGAVGVFRQVVAAAPDVPLARRELAFAQQSAGQSASALETLEPLFSAGTADPFAYQTGAAAHTAAGDPKKALKTLRRGIEKHPASGILYKELGSALEKERDAEGALRAWVDGIEAAPTYHLNYYEAAHAYVYSKELVWAILYAEIFANLERATPRAADARKILMAAYKRFFFPTAADERNGSKDMPITTPQTFEEAVEATLRKCGPAVAGGISAEALTMLRTRFIMDWNERWAARYPFALFQYHDALLREGHFDAYNQHLLGRADALAEYTAWTKFHPEAVPAYEVWSAGHPLRPGAGEAYNDKKVKDIFLKR